MSKRTKVIRYSESFKQQVIQEIEKEGLTIPEARKKFGIAGNNTIQAWAKKYGSFGILPKQIRVEKPNERNQVQDLKKEIRKLKETIADLVLDRKIAESTLEVICEQRGWDIEEIKKKAGQLLQQRQSKSKKK